MENIGLSEDFDLAVKPVSQELKKILLSVSDTVKKECTEIRLRRNLPVVIVIKNESLLLHIDSTVSNEKKNIFICDSEILTDTFSRMCGYSVHSHLSDINNGFITLEGGNRAGVVGTAALNINSQISSIRDISSVNIRIARQVKGSADILMEKLCIKRPLSMIIAGPPSSGKTTILRDFIRQISDRGYKVSVIDERMEIASDSSFEKYDLGINTDVFSAYPKIKAINIAVRTMSPQLIAIDEVCEQDEINAIKHASNCGVKMIVTIHASSYDELLSKIQISELLNTFSFEKIVLLSGADNPGEIEGIFDARELHDEILSRSICMDRSYSNWC